MAFPVVQSSTSSNSGGSTTSHVVSMPSGITAGDLLVVAACFDSSTAVTVPVDWTTVSNNLNSTTRLLILKKIAVGSDSLTLTVSVANTSAHAAYRIYSTDTTLLSGTAATGTSTTPNPPNLNNGASQQFMWIAVAGWGNGSALSSYPTNYSSNQVTNNSGNASIAMATYNVEASSEDPSTFTIASSGAWVAQTLSIDEQVGISGNFTLLTENSTIFQPSIDFAADATFSLITMSSSIFQPTATVSTATRYTNKTKPSTTWTNKTKP